MSRSEATVEELVCMIERGELRLPEMQRQYVWGAPRVRDLLDSLYRGYPSGTILLWETDEDVALQDFAVTQANYPYRRLLLDGQQRLTSLAAVIRGQPVMVRGRKKPLEILFNLEHPDDLSVITEVDEADDDDDREGDNDSDEDELRQRLNKMTFVVSSKQLESDPRWVKVSEVFATGVNSSFFERAGISSFKDPRHDKYNARLEQLRAIRKYMYRMDILERKLLYEEVTEIFVRVNSLGAKLRSSDLALAQITAKWRGSLSTFQAFQAECAKNGFDLDLGLHLKNLVVFATHQSRFRTVAGLRVALLQEAWPVSVKGMEFAINFLRNNVHIDSPILLSSPFVLVALAYYGHSVNYVISEENEKMLRYWILVSNAKGRYSRGSSETLLDQDISGIRSGEGVKGLIGRLRSQVGRLDISEDELKGRNQRSSLFKTMFLAFKAAGAKDWRSSVTIGSKHAGSEHKLQFHHLFPKGRLRENTQQRDIDDISNLAFISGRENQKIGDALPSTYIPKAIEQAGLASFQAQCIPTSSDLLSVENYQDFLLERRRLICERLNEFLGAPPEKTPEEELSDDLYHRILNAFNIAHDDVWARKYESCLVAIEEAFAAAATGAEQPWAVAAPRIDADSWAFLPKLHYSEVVRVADDSICSCNPELCDCDPFSAASVRVNAKKAKCSSCNCVVPAGETLHRIKSADGRYCGSCYEAIYYRLYPWRFVQDLVDPVNDAADENRYIDVQSYLEAIKNVLEVCIGSRNPTAGMSS
ncbi:DUF262 domain-containing protein [bacterium]|nr:DUF262 domain-containing protein [bacterium]